jgi:hypothetical protein
MSARRFAVAYERFMWRLFDQITFAAVADPRGRCNDLNTLEAATTQKLQPILRRLENSWPWTPSQAR